VPVGDACAMGASSALDSPDSLMGPLGQCWRPPWRCSECGGSRHAESKSSARDLNHYHRLLARDLHALRREDDEACISESATLQTTPAIDPDVALAREGGGPVKWLRTHCSENVCGHIQ